MKKLVLLSCLVVFAMLFVTGCGCGCACAEERHEHSHHDGYHNHNGEHHHNDGERGNNDGRVAWRVELATEENLRPYNTPVEFVEFPEEGYQRIAIIPNIEMRDFQWFEVGSNDESEDVDSMFYVRNVLHRAGDLEAHTPFVVTWMEFGTMPHRGFSFVDANGERRHYTVGMNNAYPYEGHGMFSIGHFTHSE